MSIKKEEITKLVDKIKIIFFINELGHLILGKI